MPVMCVVLMMPYVCAGQAPKTVGLDDLPVFTSTVQDFNAQVEADTVSDLAGGIPMALRRSPGSMTILTEEDIRNSGARDLTDLLQLVPGIALIGDVFSSVGIGVRGNQSQESVALLVDNLPMNELLYGSTQISGRFPLDQLARVEIIRGPGTVLYGGFSSYAVINLVTKASLGYSGIKLANTVGIMGTTDRQGFSLSLGHRGRDLSVALSAGAQQGVLSDQTYRDVYGSTYDMSNASDLKNRFITVNATYKGLQLQLLADQYQTTMRDNNNAILSRAYKNDYHTGMAMLRYEWQVSPKFKIIPFVRYTIQQPWKSTETPERADSGSFIAFFEKVRRVALATTAQYQFHPRFTLMAGAMCLLDRSADQTPESMRLVGTAVRGYRMLSTFGNATADFTYFDLIAGLRLDYHNYYYGIYSPRLALAKGWRKWHGKVCYTRAYRAPAIKNIDLAPADARLKPQTTNSVDLEVGLQASSSLSTTLVSYWINTANGIIYEVAPNGDEFYSNTSRYGTRGLEAQVDYKRRQVKAFVAYSTYTTAGMPTYQAFSVPGTQHTLGQAGHKVSWMLKLPLLHGLDMSCSGFWLAPRYTLGLASDGQGLYQITPAKTIVNLYLHYLVPVAGGLRVSLGVQDVLNQKISFIQPYSGFHAPLPGPSREIICRISYEIKR